MNTGCSIYVVPYLQCSGWPAGCGSCEKRIVVDADAIHRDFGIRWRRAKAGYAFGKDTIVVYDGDPDPRLVRCAVNDCIYISFEDLKKLPVEDGQD